MRLPGPLLIGSVLALVAALSGCTLIRSQASRYPAADVGAIYARATPNPDRNPVILIHGFTGSKLVRTADGATVWGAFFTEDAPLPSTPEGLRAVALDIGDLPSPIRSRDLADIDDDSHASALLERAHAGAVVAKVSIGIYAKMVEMVEQAGYGPCRHVDEPAIATDTPACFTFFYDWRQDNVGNAIINGEAKDNQKAYKKLVGDLKSTEKKINGSKKQVAALGKEADKFFKAWEQDLASISSESLREKSTGRMETAKKRYASLGETLTAAGQEFAPVIQDLNDQILFLGRDLSPEAIADLEDEAAALNEKAEATTAKVKDMLANAGKTQDAADAELDGEAGE